MNVNHAHGSYEIHVSSLEQAISSIPADARILTDHTVANLAAPHLVSRTVFAVEPGEASKCLKVYASLQSRLAETLASRQTTVVALGGGVIGDLAGFVAATYMRGVPFVQIPTTLLAMVDSSVGGKVGVDLPEGKNLVGSFKSPEALYLPLELLATLPKRQFVNGMAEVLKYGFILDSDLSERLRIRPLTALSPDLEAMVTRCVQLKTEVVQSDEFETNGIRAILNFGHTIGHAIEHAAGYGNILHGEAISIGMVFESKLGERLGVTPLGTAETVERDLQLYGLPTALPNETNANDLVHTMLTDKKATSGSLAFSLLAALGRCKLVKDVPLEEVLSVLNQR